MLWCDRHPKEERPASENGGNMPRRITCLKRWAPPWTGFMNSKSLSNLSLKTQFRRYDNAENVLSPQGGSCLLGGVWLFPRYHNAASETAAAWQCTRWWGSHPGGLLSVLFGDTVEFLKFASPSPGTSFFMYPSFLGAETPRAKFCFQVHWSDPSQTEFFSVFISVCP